MRAPLLTLVPALILGAAPAQAPVRQAKAFPFPIHQKTLANGLRVVVIPTGMPGLVSLQIPVSTGSRNEVEPGRSGFAHFFEHMMFRGTKQVSKKDWNLALQRTGASQNAFTSDDLTCYHTLVSKEDLETWLRLEADRFQFLDYPENEFKDESRAVLGEYNKNASNPMGKLFEVQRDAAFTTHTYKHTTMGFLRDIENMPNLFAYSKAFFRRWYAPDNVCVILVGDVQPETAFPLVEKYFGNWKKADVERPAVPAEPEAKAPLSAHVAWETPTLPYMTVAYRTPARFSTTRPDAVALDFLSDLFFGPRSELYQRLVVREQKVDQLFAGGGDSKDPELFTVSARCRKAEDMAYVRDLILETCARAVALPVSSSRLEEVKAEARMGFARNLESTERIAGMVARLASYDRDPEAVVKLQALGERVGPADLRAIARATFSDRNRVITTLCHGPLPAELQASFQGVDARVAELARLPAIALREQPSASPLVSLRLRFRTGSVDDPAGKEGLASLAAALLSASATRTHSLPELMKAYGATGGGLRASVDKELTSFSLTVPALKASEALDLMLEQLLDCAFREEDFQRVKAQQLNGLRVNLKGSNDEELGKLALEARVFAGSRLATPVQGTESGLQAITLEDVKAFVRAHFGRGNLQAGLAGGYDPAFREQLLRGLGRLPEGGAAPAPAPEPAGRKTSRLQIIAKDTRGTAISFGLPIAVDRRHPDYAALWVFSSWLGQHRNSTARLYQRLRELRGLNYGDYSYIEAFPDSGYRTQPDPGLLRSRNLFQVWVRPVTPANGAFALKAALFELDQALRKGLGEAEFEASRTFLVKYLDHMTDTPSKRLGHDMDMALLGEAQGFVEPLRAQLKALTRKQLNEAIRRHLRATGLDIVMVTKDPEALKRDLFAPASPTPKYESPKPELAGEDKAISTRKLDLKPEDVTITPLEEIFR